VRGKMFDKKYKEIEYFVGPILCAMTGMKMKIMTNIIFYPSERWMTPVQDAVFFFSVWLLSIFRILPDTTKRRYIISLVSLLFILISAAPAFCHEDRILQLDVMMVIPRFFLLVWSPPAVAIVCNGLYIVLTASKYIGFDSHQGQSAGPSWLYYYALQFIFGLFLVPMLHVKRRQEAHRIVELEVKQSELGAARALLETVCDAVVELDADYCLTERSPRLEATLMLSGNVSPKGSSFLQYMFTTDDVQCFIDNVTQAIPSAKGLAHAFHVQLRDSADLSIRTQMFHVPFLGFGQRMQHLIGISETALEAPHISSVEQRRLALSRNEVPYKVHRNFVAYESLGQVDLVSESGSEISKVSSRDHSFKICMDTRSLTLEIIDCSFSFSNTTGMHAGDRFMDILPESQRLEFVDWIQDMSNKTMHGIPTSTMQVVLRPPNLKRFGLRISGVASIEAHSPDNDRADSREYASSDFSVSYVPVILDNLQFVKHSQHLNESQREVQRGAVDIATRIGLSL